MYVNLFQIDFTKALSEIYEEKMFPSCTFHIEQDMKSPMRSWTMRHRVSCLLSFITYLPFFLWWIFFLFHLSIHQYIILLFLSVFQYDAYVACIGDSVSTAIISRSA